MTDCLFCKIASKAIPAAIVLDNADVLAFLDINPVNPGHVLVIPKQHSADLTEIDPVDLQAVADAAQRISRALLETGADGVNVTFNTKPAAGQVIFHTHAHVIPRYAGDGFAHWPGTPYAEGEDKAVAQGIRSALEKY